MKFLPEITEDVNIITEAAESTGEKSFFIEGIFMQSELKNRNGRVYPKDTMSKEVNRYNEQFVKTKRAMGELGHPPSATINLERVSHLITDLKMEGNDVYGKAKILSRTPMGLIAKNLIEEGVKFGVSSRGFGSITESNGVKMVGNDFHLSTVDIVSDPSAHHAFVQGIMESKEFYFEHGILVEKQYEQIKNSVNKATKTQLTEGHLADIFENFLNSLK